MSVDAVEKQRLLIENLRAIADERLNNHIATAEEVLVSMEAIIRERNVLRVMFHDFQSNQHSREKRK